MKQKTMAKIMYKLTMRHSRKMIETQYGNDFWKDFKNHCDEK